MSEVVAATVAAVVALRTGDDAQPLLDRAWELACSADEPQRLVPVAAALAERDWLFGTAAAGPALDRAWALVCAQPAPWEVGELAFWRHQTGRVEEPPGPVPAPVALLLAGQWELAAAAWAERECAFWRIQALTRDPSVSAGRAAVELADRSGAAASRAAILRTRRELGLPVPRGPRAAARANAAALTARELEVLSELADGLSNAEIAARLVLSEKTVGHHVSAILRKLGEPTRARAVAAARRSGLLVVPAGSNG